MASIKILLLQTELFRRTLLKNSMTGFVLSLDDCTVFDIAHPSPSVRAKMREELQATLVRLRKEFPNTILVGNASKNWTGLNGKLNEGRPEQMLKETAPYSGHVPPVMDLYHFDVFDEVMKAQVGA